jgi:3',5'-cyclic-AMP phosphodiesterase
MTKILVMTDLHLVEPGQTITGIDPWARLDAALSHMLARQGDAERLIVMGDLVHAGQEALYHELGKRLEGFPMPVHLMLGNHDSRIAFRVALPGQADDGNGFVQQVIDSGDERMILLDTLDEGPYQHWGLLDAARLDWLETAISTANGRRISLFMHHHVFPTGYRGLDSIILRDAGAFLDRCAGRVAHIFAGHVHRTISASARGIGLTTFKGTAHQSPLVFDSWDSSLSVDEPGAYGVLLFSPEAIVAHSEDFDLSVIPAGGTADRAT